MNRLIMSRGLRSLPSSAMIYKGTRDQIRGKLVSPDSENSQLYPEIQKERKVWGRAWKYRDVLNAFVSPKMKVRPLTGEIESPNIYPYDLLTVKHNYHFLTAYRYYISNERRDMRYFRYPVLTDLNCGLPHVLLYHPLVESQFYWRWYSFSRLVLDRAFTLNPHQYVELLKPASFNIPIRDMKHVI